jgi:cerevisin
MSEVAAETIPNSYIVVFKQHTPEEVCEEHCQWAQSAHSEAAAMRAESDGPELTGVGEKFDLPTLNGYVGSFDDSLRAEVEAREEASNPPPLPLSSPQLEINRQGGI